MAARTRGSSPRRRLALAAVALLLLALRVALPAAVRTLIERQASAALAGDVTVGDVDVALVRGAVVLKDVALHGAGPPAGAPPLVAWDRLAVDVGWLALPRRTVRFDGVDLTGLRVQLERRADGTFVVPQLRLEESEPAGDEPSEWAVVIARATMRDATIRLRDHVVTPAEEREIHLPELAVAGLRLQPGPERQPGRGSLRLEIGDGAIDVGTRVAALADGFALALRARLAGVPLDRVHVHVPELGWSASSGRVDGTVGVRLHPRTGLTVGGELVLRDVAARVPTEEDTALAFRRLELDVALLDLPARTAEIARVAIDGARLIVRPRAEMPLTILSRLGAGDAAPARAETPAPGGSPAPSPEVPADAPADAEPEAAPAAWTWRVDTLAITDALVKVFLEPPPLEVAIPSATVRGLSSAPGATVEVVAELREGDGTVGVAGSVQLDPPAGTLAVRIESLALHRLVTASGTVPLNVPSGTLAGHVQVTAAPEAVTLEGRLTLDDPEMLLAEGDDFAVRLAALEVDVARLHIPRQADGGAESGAGPIEVELSEVRLVAPRVRLTYEAAGLVLPASGPSPAPTPGPDDPPAPSVQVAVRKLAVERGEIVLVDRTVEPTFRGRLTALSVDGSGIAATAPAAERLALSFEAAGGAPVTVTGSPGRDTGTLTVTVADLPLRSYNPYAVPRGYRIGGGTLDLESTVEWDAEDYEADVELDFDDLAVTELEASPFRRLFGLRLAVALALLRDIRGGISLGVPVRGSRGQGARVSLAPIITDALRQAITGALVSPLKLLGAVTLGDGGGIAEFDPTPIAFAPGTAVVAAGARAEAARLGTALAALPSLAIGLRGESGPADVRGLAEEAVRQDLQAESDLVGGLKNLLSRGKRSAIRRALAARARGEEAALEEDARADLDAMVAEQTVDDDALRALAARRAEALRARLVEERGIDARRVTILPPRVDPASGPSAVTVEIGPAAGEVAG